MAETDTKTQLMDIAEQQVRCKGADGFSYSDLSKQVGISKASIHYHFPAKSDLLTAIMNRYAKQVAAMLNARMSECPRAAQQAIACLDIYRNALQEGATLCLCVAYTVSQDGLSSDTNREILRFRRAILTWLEDVFARAEADGSIRDLSDARTEAAAFLALVEGAQIASRISGKLADYDLATKKLRDRLIDTGDARGRHSTST